MPNAAPLVLGTYTEFPIFNEATEYWTEAGSPLRAGATLADLTTFFWPRLHRAAVRPLTDVPNLALDPPLRTTHLVDVHGDVFVVDAWRQQISRSLAPPRTRGVPLEAYRDTSTCPNLQPYSLYFDRTLYTTEALELLMKVVGRDRVLFGTETPGHESFEYEGLKANNLNVNYGVGTEGAFQAVANDPLSNDQPVESHILQSRPGNLVQESSGDERAEEIEPLRGRGIPLKLRLIAALKLIEETVRHPLTTSYFGVNRKTGTVVVRRG